MRRPTGFTMDYSYVALDVDVWCPDVVVVVVMCMCVCVCGGGALVGGGGGGGEVETHFTFNKHGWPESEILV